MKYFIAAAGLMGAIACADSTSPTALRSTGVNRDMDVNQTVPAALATVNPCNGDAVALTGTLHFIIHTTTATSGTQQFYIDFTSNYSGTGLPSGVNYQATTHQLEEFSTRDPYPIVYRFYVDEHLLSATGVNNYDMTTQYHVTINNDGTVTAVVDNTDSKCTG